MCGKTQAAAEDTKVKGFSIYGEDDGGPSNRTKLRLIRLGDRSVMLVAVDDDGDPLEAGHVLQIQEDGRLFREPGLNDNIGFTVTNTRAVIKEAK